MKYYHQDIITFVSSLTARKILNVIKIYGSYILSKVIGRAHIYGLPITVALEPTTSCNLQCPECPSGLRQFTRATGNLKESLFNRLIKDVHRDIIYLIFYFQGEPYIHPSFLDMVKLASNKGLYTITSTNGHFLNEDLAKKTVLSGLSRLIISVDGTDQDTYANYRKGGNLSVVLQGAQNIITQKKILKKKTPHVIFQFLVFRQNEHQIGDLKKLAKEIGVDEVKIKTAQIYNYKNGHPLIPRNDKYSRYIEDSEGNYQLKRDYNINKHCWKMWHSSVITWDGKVIPCCFDKDAQNILSSYNEKSTFSSIWHGKKYNEFRNQVISSRKNISICANCTEGVQIWS